MKKNLTKMVSTILVILLLTIFVACTSTKKNDNPDELTITSFEVSTDVISAQTGDDVVIPEVSATLSNGTSIKAIAEITSPSGQVVQVSNNKITVILVGEYKIKYTVTYGENKTQIKTRKIVVSQKPELKNTTLLNGFNSIEDMGANIWYGDNTQPSDSFSLNTVPSYLIEGAGSLKVNFAKKASNYWPGVKFMSFPMTDINDFSDYYSIVFFVYNDSNNIVWLKLGNPGKDVKVEANKWTRCEILISEMDSNGMNANELANVNGTCYFWFTMETGTSAFDMYVDGLCALKSVEDELPYVYTETPVEKEPDPITEYVLLNGFEIESDIVGNLWYGDGVQSSNENAFVLNTDSTYVKDGNGSLKINFKQNQSNYWPGVKFMSFPSTIINDFSDYYSLVFYVYNNSENVIWLKLGNPGKDIRVDSKIWVRCEITVSEMSNNGMNPSQLANTDGSCYCWFTMDSSWEEFDMYVDALYMIKNSGDIIPCEK